MAVREILQIGNPTLRKRSRPVVRFDDALSRLAEEMIETMHAADGVGLAAPQIGVLARLIVLEMPGDEDDQQPGERFIVCNPKIAKKGREIEVGQEGCLSVAGYVGQVERATRIVIDGQNLKGKKIRIKAEGFLARAFQHEIDHLDGVLYVDLAEDGSVISLEELEQRAAAQEQGEPARPVVT
jgi:peptide deformylase